MSLLSACLCVCVRERERARESCISAPYHSSTSPHVCVCVRLHVCVNERESHVYEIAIATNHLARDSLCVCVCRRVCCV